MTPPPSLDPESLRSAVWQVLRRGYVRLLAKLEGRRAETLTEAEASLLIDPHTEEFVHDFHALCLVIGEAQRNGAEHVRLMLESQQMPPEARIVLDEALSLAARVTAEPPSV